jgi:hypothetical protein
MSKIPSVSKALAPFKLENQKEFDFETFKVTLKRFTMSDPQTRALVERMQRVQRRKPGNAPRDLRADVEAFCKISLVSWTLRDDSGKPVPIEQAPEVLLGSREGTDLYYNLIEMARSGELFDADEEAVDQAEAKN